MVLVVSSSMSLSRWTVRCARQHGLGMVMVIVDMVVQQLFCYTSTGAPTALGSESESEVSSPHSTSLLHVAIVPATSSLSFFSKKAVSNWWPISVAFSLSTNNSAATDAAAAAATAHGGDPLNCTHGGDGDGSGVKRQSERHKHTHRESKSLTCSPPQPPSPSPPLEVSSGCPFVM